MVFIMIHLMDILGIAMKLVQHAIKKGIKTIIIVYLVHLVISQNLIHQVKILIVYQNALIII